MRSRCVLRLCCLDWGITSPSNLSFVSLQRHWSLESKAIVETSLQLSITTLWFDVLFGCTGSPKSHIWEVECGLRSSQEEDSNGSRWVTQAQKGTERHPDPRLVEHQLLKVVMSVLIVPQPRDLTSLSVLQELSLLVASVDKNIESVLKVCITSIFLGDGECFEINSSEYFIVWIESISSLDMITQPRSCLSCSRRTSLLQSCKWHLKRCRWIPLPYLVYIVCITGCFV